MIATAIGLAVAVSLAFLGWYYAGTAEITACLRKVNDLVNVALENASDQTLLIKRIRVCWRLVDGEKVQRSIMKPFTLRPGQSTIVDDPSIPEIDFCKLIVVGTLLLTYKSRPPFTYRKRLIIRSYSLID